MGVKWNHGGTQQQADDRRTAIHMHISMCPVETHNDNLVARHKPRGAHGCPELAFAISQHGTGMKGGGGERDRLHAGRGGWIHAAGYIRLFVFQTKRRRARRGRPNGNGGQGVLGGGWQKGVDNMLSPGLPHPAGCSRPLAQR